MAPAGFEDLDGTLLEETERSLLLSQNQHSISKKQDRLLSSFIGSDMNRNPFDMVTKMQASDFERIYSGTSWFEELSLLMKRGFNNQARVL